ncbi:hypothetical protein DES40_1909 [Litorimonas taeanensis]|uniref:Uncharacterized protein n=1 Tax=Litorimonas taeanensis TaxID=568099 RepID=A0A420WDV1_9PROT|nr:hypothetical protein [Litorimonas taeanensis]RKQ69125.1 hypothetical protein DES40_1909 [Litorimonas taeanensis]
MAKLRSPKLRYLASIAGCIFLIFSVWCSAIAQTNGNLPPKGLTFTAARSLDATNTASASCGKTSQGDPMCNPYEGDTYCSTALPLLCILDIDAPVPSTLSDSKYWSGGVLAKSSPWRGTDISTLKQANGICTQSFGKKWRVASFHDGGGWAVEGYGVLSEKGDSDDAVSLWVDIKDQPSGTCWSR